MKDDIQYIEYFGTELTAFDYLGTSTTFVIPNEMDGKPVRFLAITGRGYSTGLLIKDSPMLL